VRIKSKKLVGVDQDTERVVHNVLVGGLATPTAASPVSAATVEEIPIDRETFDISYECKHCHHKWTEEVTVTEEG
jgi:hypothetical protein